MNDEKINSDEYNSDEYIEAVRIITSYADGSNNDYDKRLRLACAKKSQLLCVFTFGAVVLALSFRSPAIGTVAVFLGCWASLQFYPLLVRSVDKKFIKNGNYFATYSEDEIIEEASREQNPYLGTHDGWVRR